ncbi:hypothetical protein PGTUg99_004308 [Puccinia graminis f. sp. tritici]|uniref:C2H2-type domain-containing protein n=1 Tax=Puccinia graminis f. sp. tritici TaxID=56615 RepID=A0A5B0RZD6_PUCGR|nr:hypothetical protein PGTUg99_004308 [Puccinia graminis f. sp. tritici]
MNSPKEKIPIPIHPLTVAPESSCAGEHLDPSSEQTGINFYPVQGRWSPAFTPLTGSYPPGLRSPDFVDSSSADGSSVTESSHSSISDGFSSDSASNETFVQPGQQDNYNPTESASAATGPSNNFIRPEPVQWESTLIPVLAHFSEHDTQGRSGQRRLNSTCNESAPPTAGPSSLSHTVEKFANLKAHMMTHQDPKPIECQVCQPRHAYYRHNELKEHVESLTDPISGQPLRLRFDKNSHMRKKSDEVLSHELRTFGFMCALCESMYTSAAEVEAHLVFHHGRSQQTEVLIHQRTPAEMERAASKFDDLLGLTTWLVEEYKRLKKQHGNR